MCSTAHCRGLSLTPCSNRALPSTTLDLSDIKWGILEPRGQGGVKQEGRRDDQHMSIREELD